MKKFQKLKNPSFILYACDVFTAFPTKIIKLIKVWYLKKSFAAPRTCHIEFTIFRNLICDAFFVRRAFAV